MKEFPGVKALQGVNLDVEAGEVHCLLGANGAGKSTLIKCISGAHEPTSGEILFMGEPLPVGDPAESLKRGVATIYQELDLVDDLTVAESIFLAHEPRRGPLLNFDEMHREANALLARLGHPAISARTKVRALRPAAQQIVSIARALSVDVRLLIMDEPSAILDEGEIETLFDVVRRLTADGVGVVYISHRLDEIRRIGNRVTVLADGRTTATGVPATTPTDDLVELMVGHKVEQLYPDRPTATARFFSTFAACDCSRRCGTRRSSFTPARSSGSGAWSGWAVPSSFGSSTAWTTRKRARSCSTAPRFPGSPSGAIAAGLGLAPEDRKSQALLLDWSQTKNVTLASLRRFARPLLSIRGERNAAREQLQAAEHGPGRSRSDRPPALRRQPAEGRARAVAAPRLPGSAAR